jgi:hypothetical protein
VRKWAIEEFAGLLEKDPDPLGATYLCHKKNGGVCVGFLMNQDARDFPSIRLRVDLMRRGVGREYLDRLRSPAPLYASIRAMVRANFPSLLRRKRNADTHGA